MFQRSTATNVATTIKFMLLARRALFKDCLNSATALSGALKPLLCTTATCLGAITAELTGPAWRPIMSAHDDVSIWTWMQSGTHPGSRICTPLQSGAVVVFIPAAHMLYIPAQPHHHHHTIPNRNPNRKTHRYLMLACMSACSWMRAMRSPFYGVPLNIAFGRAMLAVLIGMVTTATSLILVILIGAVKCIPFTVAAYWKHVDMVQRLPQARMVTLGPLWLICALVVAPIGVVVTWSMFLLACATYVGPVSGIESYFGR